MAQVVALKFWRPVFAHHLTRCYRGADSGEYVRPNTVSVSQRLNDSLSMNCLNSSVSSFRTAVITRASGLDDVRQPIQFWFRHAEARRALDPCVRSCYKVDRSRRGT